eukprot:TRINITY_DN2543_c0_g5_i1.p1 TRINITY_DN2543_c0_g5~~TRINITY_DN2543_c0_g5_i1.p1  ORF type:complete len:411 (-),score=30.24 TRINITY_DN2543_c0_g5_i1:26-1258(-)
MEKKNLSLRLKFKVNVKTTLGESVYISGNLFGLGEWEAARAIELHTSSTLYPLWESEYINIKLNPAEKEDHLYFKFIKMFSDRKSPKWEAGENRQFPQVTPLHSLDAFESFVLKSDDFRDDYITQNVQKYKGYFTLIEIPKKVTIEDCSFAQLAPTSWFPGDQHFFLNVFDSRDMLIDMKREKIWNFANTSIIVNDRLYSYKETQFVVAYWEDDKLQKKPLASGHYMHAYGLACVLSRTIYKFSGAHREQPNFEKYSIVQDNWVKLAAPIDNSSMFTLGMECADDRYLFVYCIIEKGKYLQRFDAFHEDIGWIMLTICPKNFIKFPHESRKDQRYLISTRKSVLEWVDNAYGHCRLIHESEWKYPLNGVVIKKNSIERNWKYYVAQKYWHNTPASSEKRFFAYSGTISLF